MSQLFELSSIIGSRYNLGYLRIKGFDYVFPYDDLQIILWDSAFVVNSELFICINIFKGRIRTILSKSNLIENRFFDVFFCELCNFQLVGFSLL